MSRFLVRREAISGERVVFDRGESHHLARVLRLAEGDLVEAVDGEGSRYTVRLTRLGARAAEGVVLARGEGAAESPLALVLAQGVPKGDKLERIVRMATELGVSRVDPLVTARTVGGDLSGGGGRRLARYRRIAAEAAKQCGRSRVPEVREPEALERWIERGPPPGLLLCLWEREPRPLDAVLPDGPLAHATLVVGPEGGLAEREVDALRGAGAVVAGLGPRILRCESAGPVGLALLQARYGDLGRGRPGVA